MSEESFDPALIINSAFASGITTNASEASGIAIFEIGETAFIARGFGKSDFDSRGAIRVYPFKNLDVLEDYIRDFGTNDEKLAFGRFMGWID